MQVLGTAPQGTVLKRHQPFGFEPTFNRACYQARVGHDLAVGDHFTWRSHSVELTALAQLGGDWNQVVVRFLDDVNRPPMSMPQQDLIAGLAA